MSVGEKIRKFFHKAEKEGQVARGKTAKDKTYSSSRTFPDRELAIEAFQQSKKKLFDVNRWSEIPNPLSAVFKAFDVNGTPLYSSKIRQGDYIKINLPGPLPANWVRVIAVKDQENLAEFIVSPSENPTDNKTETKHFFHKGATSTFRTERKGNTITAYEIGKNEKINVKDPEAGNRKVLNIAVAEGGWAGFQKLQWKNLTRFLVMESI
ncbi:MAG: hypothetical protein ACJ75J_17450 [Cytophagaceae bacterium]